MVEKKRKKIVYVFIVRSLFAAASIENTCKRIFCRPMNL